MTLTTSTRELTIEVAYNVRHLGGYHAEKGRTTSEAIIRSAGLHRLTTAGMRSLADAGVRMVVDLRSQVEKERDVTPDLAPVGITRIEAPVFEQDASPVGLASEFPGYAVVYERMLNSGRAAYRALFETIASTDGGLLFHCAAGKDRTGVAAALLLGVVGVSDETIVEDFVLTERLLEPMIAEWLPKMAERGISEEQGRALMATKPSDMASTVAHIQTRFGGAEGYMQEIGMSGPTISALKGRLAG
jgi:protein-tyrosine phosphatase